MRVLGERLHATWRPRFCLLHRQHLRDDVAGHLHDGIRASTMRSKLVDLAVLGVSGFVGSAVARTIATALRCAESLAARAAAGAVTRAAADAADATASQMGKVAAAGKLGE